MQHSNVTILILIDGFLQYTDYANYKNQDIVTILILIDGFLQLKIDETDIIANNESQSLF